MTQLSDRDLFELASPLRQVEPVTRPAGAQDRHAGEAKADWTRRIAVGLLAAAATAAVLFVLALAAHTRSSAPAPVNPHPRPLTPQAELDVFMNRLKPRLATLQSDMGVARSELRIYMANPTTTTGTTLGLRMFHTSGAIGEDDYASLAAVPVPGALNPAWSQFKHLVKHAAGAVLVMDDDLRTNDARAARRGRHQFIQQTRQPVAWLKAALVRYAATAHLRLPAWVDKVDTGT